jgi:sulfotransferase family protein
MNYKFIYHSLRRDCFNFSLLAHRDFDSMLITMHQSGTHWLKYMLTLALVEKLGIDKPEYIQDDMFFGNPSSYQCNYEINRIASAHSIPHLLIGSKLLNKMIYFPRYIILVRDMRASLVSNYEKWKHDNEYTNFSTFLRGDEKGKRFNSDIWWCIRFYNAWGRVLSNIPDQTMSIKYEDLITNTHDILKNISAFMELELYDEHLQHGINEASKKKMQKKNDPSSLTVVRVDKRMPIDWFSEEDKLFFVDACQSHLKHDFGYNFYDMS